MKMFYKKQEILVEVYRFFDNNTALIFSPSNYGRTGNGWEKVKISQLVPEEYFDPIANGFMSKTEKNKIKKRLTLTHATWTCSDGINFTNFDNAIEHEKGIMDFEKIKE